ncbi:hypothetical protein [Thioflexithrix psekupsensis]|uniref:TIGR02646 family protein n=1 Tax=Thioflexithrix psekupsensis TaxID=1570016 RepID=A0A251X8Z3_9GAMM|nr:hypothetical protein [Thioflexithrix psekupsensis]OUD14405.1 hypothetical protein TPSD3_08840 [Thioflexithrix psekupsensis]
MIRVRKKPCPALENFKEQEKQQGIKPVYKKGLARKEEYKEHFRKVREQLLEEQGYVCCYCQQRISLPKDEKGNSLLPEMSVEHFKPKSKEEYKHLQLDYDNLFAACEGYTHGQSHCNNRKGGEELKDIPNLATKKFDGFRIRYINYTIRKSGDRKESDLKCIKVARLRKENEENDDPLTGKKEGCLNLNHQTLANRRYEAWIKATKLFYEGCGENWHTDKGKKLAQEIIDDYSKPNEKGELKEFYQVIIDLIKKEFKI